MDSWDLVAAERRRLATELEAVPPARWNTPSQCQDWTVRDVAAHIAMTPALRIGAVLPTMIRYRFNVPRVISVLARNDRRTPAELVQALRDVAESHGTPPQATVHNVLADIVVHGQDIRRPLGLPCSTPEATLRAAADTLARTDFNCGSAKRARGLHLVASDAEWSHGTGPEVRGPLHAIIEAIGGRSAALDDLSGDGVAILASRCPRPSRVALPVA